jgi:hypothetical protein
VLTFFTGTSSDLLFIREPLCYRSDNCRLLSNEKTSQENRLRRDIIANGSLITVGAADGSLLRDDEVGEEHEEHAGDDADVDVALHQAFHALPWGASPSSRLLLPLLRASGGGRRLSLGRPPVRG